MKKIFTLVAVFSLLALLSSCISTADHRSTVSVDGEGVVELVPDMASFNISVSETKDTTSLAQQSVNSEISEILSILHSNGITDPDIKTTGLDIRTSWDWIDGKQVRRGETATQNLCVEVYDLNSLGTIIDSLGSVQGVSISSVNFDVKDKTIALEKARSLAIADAKAKAVEYCGACGMTLGMPISINEGYSTYNPLKADYMVEMGAMAKVSNSTELPSGTLTCKVNVSTVWQIH